MKSKALGIALSVFLATGCTVTRGGNLDAGSTVKEDPAAAAAPGAARFAVLIAKIDTYLQDNLGTEVTQAKIQPLAQSGIRNELFRIQNLAELYAPRYPQIEQIRSSSKQFEDRVGGAREAKEKLEFAISHNASQAKIDQLTAALESQEQGMVTFLQSGKWLSGVEGNKIAEYQALVASLAWDEDVTDREYLLKALCQQAMAIDAKPWDMTADLNSQFGLHALKKDVRWQRLEMGLMAGDILDNQNDNCANDPLLTQFNTQLETGGALGQACVKDDMLQDLANVAASGHCQVSSCYIQRIDQLYTLLSNLKDEAEGLAAIGQEMPPEKLQDAHAKYVDFKTFAALRKVSYELKSCLNKTPSN